MVSLSLSPRRGTPVLAGALVILGHLYLVRQHQTAAQLGITLLCWFAAVLLVTRQSQNHPPDRSLIALATGGLIMLALWGVALLRPDVGESLAFYYPVIGGAGWAIFARGFAGLGCHWKPLTILFVLGIPRGVLAHWIDLAPVTAATAAGVLHYMGQEVKLVGTQLVLPGGAVVVDKGCDGTGVIAYLLCLAVAFVLLFPVRRKWWGWIVLLAMLLAFCTNLARVITLTMLETSGRHGAFDFWHDGQGALLWTLLPVVLFAALATQFLPQGRPRPAASRTIFIQT